MPAPGAARPGHFPIGAVSPFRRVEPGAEALGHRRPASGLAEEPGAETRFGRSGVARWRAPTTESLLNRAVVA